MKKTISVFVLLLTIVLFSSFNRENAAPRLYPELDRYFAALNLKQVDQSHAQSLENIKSNLSMSNMDRADWNIIFYCSENSFRSQASQVFLQTLSFANKHKNVKVFSAGKTASGVDARLIDYLTQIGYKVSKTERRNATAYEVRFSDQADPIVLFSKPASDKSLPGSDVTSVIVCDSGKEAECKDIQTSSLQFKLPFEKVETADARDKAEKVLKHIATEMAYVTNKRN
ncbi:arsenate reductase/protein-tyrosine-phosphatase family protein [Chitinophaga sp. 22620]|uniref:arsenate reductase/protein-tyrosine-phosphatase family protein n=1 Tax=Chitinophaga sp. 22620 TaxID=3453952 RepID=UPI003F82A1CE